MDADFNSTLWRTDAVSGASIAAPNADGLNVSGINRAFRTGLCVDATILVAAAYFSDDPHGLVNQRQSVGKI